MKNETIKFEYSANTLTDADTGEKGMDHYMKVAELHKKLFDDNRTLEEIALDYMQQVAEIKRTRHC